MAEFLGQIVGSEIVQRLTAPLFRSSNRNLRPAFLITLWCVAVGAFALGGYLISHYEHRWIQAFAVGLIVIVPMYALAGTFLWRDWRREINRTGPAV